MTTPPFSAERRAEDGALLMLVKQVHEGQQALDEKLTQHMTNETRELAEAVSDMMKRSFPGGDPDGHRRAHEAQIAAIEARAEFWKKLLFELTKYGLIGLAGWLFIIVWTALLKGPK